MAGCRRSQEPADEGMDEPGAARVLNEITAAKLIENSETFQQEQVLRLALGEQPVLGDAEGRPYYALAELGYIRLGKGTKPETWSVILTGKGRKNASQVQECASGQADCWAEFPIAHRELVEVTGVTVVRETSAGVDYTWRWVPTEVGKALVEVPGTLYASAAPLMLKAGRWIVSEETFTVMEAPAEGDAQAEEPEASEPGKQ
ncbi:MAG: hypothetical protein ACRD7E_29130 [Bryobacteraceae bacterium]